MLVVVQAGSEPDGRPQASFVLPWAHPSAISSVDLCARRMVEERRYPCFSVLALTCCRTEAQQALSESVIISQQSYRGILREVFQKYVFLLC